jgi:phytoene dehydrogenase-like protein
MSDFEAIVIGAGNAGLTAAVTLAKSGVRTLLLEQHNVPGGAATSFIRGRFEFEVALHQLSGLGTVDNPGPLRGMFAKMGILDKLEFVEEHDIYRTWVPGRLDITLPADRQGVIETLTAHFPQEAEGIKRFFGVTYQLVQDLFKGLAGRDPDFGVEKYPAYCNYALRDSESVMNEFLKDPLLKLAIASYWGYVGQPPKTLSFLDLALLLFLYIEYKPYHLKGGSQALSQALLDSFHEAGGTARFSCGARQIKVDNGQVRAVVTDNGDEIETPCVISNASLPTTYLDMIGPDHLPPEALAELKPRSVGPSAITAYCGLDCNPEDIGIEVSTTFTSLTGNVDTMGGSQHSFAPPDGVMMTCYDVADPEFSPEGCCHVSLICLSYADHWLALPPESYHETKYRQGALMVDFANSLHPGFKDALEEVEIATPLTHMNYLKTPGGSIYGFDQMAKDTSMFVSHRPLIKGLYNAGAWVGTGGFQPTLQSGVSAAKKVIKSMN